MRSLSSTTNSSRKTRRISVFQRLSYCTNPPANGVSKPVQSANARRRDSTSNLMFLVSHARNGNKDYSVITTENNKNSSFTFRLVPDDDDDFPHNLSSLIRVENYTVHEFSGYPVMGSCDSYIWVLCAQNPHPYDLLLPFWSYAKLIITCWLVIPYISEAAYVYEQYVRPYLVTRQKSLNIWYVPKKKDIFSKPDDILTAAEKHIQENGSEAFEKMINRVCREGSF
ncbi:protein HVA22 [Striga asiatica]|uniref:Protein HVA22 n=1 Tax=Striga asiatica TaxID=4170 RepID=A0A5A7PSW8_STRAF|nr:protein HVA22 [Striga asiatica]